MTSTRDAYFIKSEPQRDCYEALINFCAMQGAFGTLADLFPSSKAGKNARAAFLDSAGSDICSLETVDRWPLGEPQTGGDDRATSLWKFKLTTEMVDVLTNGPRGLYDWLAPKLPEDLAIYRSDGSVLLGTVAHEHIGWMNLTPSEAEQVRRCAVELRLQNR